MILRKPYAFLIKHFKLIHIMMFLMLGYLAFPLRKLYIFFQGYAKTNNFTYINNMARTYISSIMIVFVIIIIVLSIAIYLLMHKKEKPVFFYRILIIYSLIVLFFLIYAYNFFLDLDIEMHNPLEIMIMRDISLFLYYINFFYVLFCMIRGVGFDIKKFSFDKDIQELHLEESDDEEYELNLNIDRENVKNYFQRQRREFKYYLQENALILSIILILILLISGGFIYYHFFVSNKVYNQSESIKLNDVVYKVSNSYITDKNLNNEIILKNTNFVIVNLDIENSGVNQTIKKDQLRISIDNQKYYAIDNYNNAFSDLGTAYNNNLIKRGEKANYVFIFKVDSLINQDVYLEISKGNANLDYFKMLLNPLREEHITETRNMGDEIKINNSTLKIANYEILEKSSYQYEDCYMEKCSVYTKTIMPKIGETLLILEIDDNNFFNNDFYDNYVGLRNENRKLSTSDVKLIIRNENKLYFSASSEFLKQDELTLQIKMRNIEYNVLLTKGEFNE